MNLESELPNPPPGVSPAHEPPQNSVAPGDTFHLDGDFRGATINIKTITQADPLWDTNRDHMLKRIRKDWLESVLEPARSSHALIALGIQHQPRLVESPWDNVVQRAERLVSLSSTSQHILDIFDSANGSLLILGEPGAGKTITLLQLAHELVQRAETNRRYLIPVVLNLSSWEEGHAAFETWLIEELRGKYFVPRSVAETWVAQDVLALLLDGLDEVPEEKRSTCIEAINAYRYGHGPAQIVVCSRRADYENLAQRLQLDDAVILQPLDQKQVNRFLADHSQGQAITATLDQDTTLRQLARTPLMLHIMLQASREISTQDWSQLGGIAAHRERLFDVYLNHVFRRRGPSQAQIEEATQRVLPWLARSMSEQGQTVFLMEGLSPAWLKSRRQRLIHMLGMHLLIASLLALAIAQFYLVGDSPIRIAARTALAIGTAALVTGIASARLNNLATLLLHMVLTSLTCSWALEGIPRGLVAGILWGIPTGAAVIAARNPRITERLDWSWRRILVILGTVILVEFLAGLFLYRTAGIAALTEIAGVLQLVALPLAIGILLVFGWRPSLRVASTVKPNQGFWHSLWNAAGIILFLMLVILPLSIPAGLSSEPGSQQIIWDLHAILGFASFVLSTGWLVALPFGLAVGGAACLQQIVLRSILARAEKLPWNLIGVLDNATDRILLQRVGGGYIFQHRLLQDYFANLQPKAKEREQT
jgi:hypothetical protein